MKSRKSTPDIMGDLMAVKTQMVEEAQEPVKKAKKEPQEEAQAPKNTTQTGLPSAWTRATFIVNKDLNEKIKAVAYWDRLTVKEVLHEALMEYLKGRSVKPVPKKKQLEL